MTSTPRPSIKRIAALSLGFGLFAMGLAHAGQKMGGGGGPPPTVVDKRILGPGSTGSFRRSVTGDFDGDLRPDLAVVRGNSLEFIGSPGVYGWWSNDYPQLGSLNDLTRLPALAGETTDGLVTVGGLGAKKCNDFGTEHPFTLHSWPTVTTLGGPLWKAAKLVDASAVPGDPAPRILGVMSDRRTLRQLRHDGTSYAFDEAVALSVALPEDIVELELVDFAVDAPGEEGTPEIALATTSALVVFRLDGTLVAFHPYSYATTTAMMSGNDGTGGLDWVVVSVVLGAGTEYVRVFDAAGAKPPILVPGAPGVAAMSPIHWGYADPQSPDPEDPIMVMDDATDILFSHSGFDGFWIAVNQGAGTFDLTDGDTTRQTFPVAPNPDYTGPANQAFFAAADVDGDTDEDVLCPNQSWSALDVSLNDDVDHEEEQPRLIVEDPIGDPEVYSPGCGALPPATPEPDVIRLTYKLTVPSVGNAMYVVAWKHANPSANTNPRAVVNRRIDPSEYADGIIDFDLPNPDHNDPACGNEQEVQLINAYFWEHHMVTEDAGGDVIAVHPAQVFGIETRVDDAYDPLFDPLNLLPDPIGVNYPAPDNSELPVGCIIQTPCLPYLPPDRPVVK